LLGRNQCVFGLNLLFQLRSRRQRICHFAERGLDGLLILRHFDGLIPRLLRRFRTKFPRVHMRLHSLRPWQQAEALLENDLNLGFIGLPMPELSPRLDFEVFRRDRMVAALPIGHPLLDRRVLRLMDLATEPFIFLTRAGTPVYYDWLMHLCHDAGFHPNVVQGVESGQTAVELVAAGSGVALFPATAQRQLHGDMSFHALAGYPSSSLRSPGEKMMIRRC